MEKEAENCWEFMNCAPKVRKNCPAFKNDFGKECWLIAGSLNKEPHCPKNKEGIKCWDCDWYKKCKEKKD